MKKLVSMLSSLAMVVSLINVAPVAAVEETKTYTPGITITENKDFPESEAKYQVEFVYEADENVTAVDVLGNFTFYTADQEEAYVAGEAITFTDPYHYKEGMFTTGYAVSEYGYAPMAMSEVEENVYDITVPLPAGMYFYGFSVTTAEGTTTVQDPTNKSFEFEGKNSGWSLMNVGQRADLTDEGQYAYPRTDGKEGRVEYRHYTAVDGSTQTVGIYTPYGYDPAKEYKVMYLSHGGGGNEVEWYGIGAAKNIMDNLIAENEVEPTIVVTMNNTVWNFEKGPATQNLVENIIPFIEANYKVSKDASGRAVAGLSSGAATTADALLKATNEFGYYGVWSPSRTSGFGNAADYKESLVTEEQMEAFKDVRYVYCSVGIFDTMVRRGATTEVNKIVSEVNENTCMIWKNGAHDWNVWRYQLAEFVKDYLWEYNTECEYPEGVTVTTNKDFPESDAPYQATFVYKPTTPAKEVSLVGNFQFYSEDQVAPIVKGEPSYAHTPYEYKEGMFNAGYGVTELGYVSLPMTKYDDGSFAITLPLPGTEYAYGFSVDGTTVKDPTNMPVANDGSDSGWSLLYVGNSETCLPGQEYIYARDDQNGTMEFVEYTAVDGTKQPLSVYLPYGYDANKAYKTLYISHGGGGNEVEWMYIGSAMNIFDNLIAEGEVLPTIVVAMDNTYFGWDGAKMVKNMNECVIPYIEANYAAIPEKDSRAFAGLSMGGFTTVYQAVYAQDTYGYYGIFSPNFRAKDTLVEADEELLKALNGSVYYQNCGSVDTGNGSQDRRGTVAYVDETLTKYASVTTEWCGGAHDWGIWREALSIFAKDYLWTGVEEATGTQTIEVTGDAWGPAVTKTIVTLDTEIDADSIDATDFNVVETKEAVDWSAPGYPRISATAARKVLKAYLCDEAGNPTTAKTGKTIAIEMYVSPSEGSPFIYDMNVGLNSWCAFYSLDITLNGVITSEGKEVKALSVAKDIDLLDRTQTAIPQMADMSLSSYKGTDGIELSYAAYEPAKDEKTNALVIWLHGSGEGGTDPTINMLGNEVTRLVSDQFQATMGGAYVLAPQSPVKWSYDGENQYCTGHTSGNKDGDTDSLYVATLTELIKDYVAKHPDIDPNRIIISGCSNGGYMTTRMIMANPGYFAAAVLNSESFMDANISDEQLKAIVDDEIGLWYIYCTADDVANSSVPTTQRLLEAKKDNLHIDIYDSVQDTSGRFTDAEGNPYTYNAHWAWIHFFTNYSHDGDLSVWEWMAKQARTAPVTPDNGGTTGGQTGGNTTGGTTPNVGIYNNAAYVAIATIALAGAAYVAFKKKED